MKFFIIVSFVITSFGVDRPMYVFSKPTFDSMNDCKAYVSVKYMDIYKVASSSYNFKLKPEAIWCIDTDKMKEIFKPSNETKKQNI